MKGYKTVIFNTAVTLLPIVDIIANSGALLGQNGVAVVSVIGLMNIVLRWITTTPIFKQG